MIEAEYLIYLYTTPVGALAHFLGPFLVGLFIISCPKQRYMFSPDKLAY